MQHEGQHPQKGVESHEALNSKLELGELIFNLDEERKESLRQRVSEKGGRVRLFVHPDYSEDFSPLSDFVTREVEDMRKGVEKVVASQDPKRPPLFFMLSKDDILSTEDMFAHASNQSSDILIIPTYKHSATPLNYEEAQPDCALPQDHESQEEFPITKDEDERWNKVVTFLKDVGVQSIIVGGMNFVLSENDNESHGSGFSIGGCVGDAINKLRDRDVNVVLSEFSYPDGPKQLDWADGV